MCGFSGRMEGQRKESVTGRRNDNIVQSEQQRVNRLKGKMSKASLYPSPFLSR